MKRQKTSLIILIFVLLIILVILSSIYQNSISKNQCNYGSGTKNYIGKSEEECSRIQFLCTLGFQEFSDNCGCGCEKINYKQEQNLCPPESRNADACIQLYQPVCGFFNSEKIQCIKYPCTQTFSNSCFACMNEDILYWTEGECPE